MFRERTLYDWNILRFVETNFVSQNILVSVLQPLEKKEHYAMEHSINVKQVMLIESIQLYYFFADFLSTYSINYWGRILIFITVDLAIFSLQFYQLLLRDFMILKLPYYRHTCLLLLCPLGKLTPLSLWNDLPHP